MIHIPRIPSHRPGPNPQDKGVFLFLGLSFVISVVFLVLIGLEFKDKVLSSGYSAENCESNCDARN